MLVGNPNMKPVDFIGFLLFWEDSLTKQINIKSPLKRDAIKDIPKNIQFCLNYYFCLAFVFSLVSPQTAETAVNRYSPAPAATPTHHSGWQYTSEFFSVSNHS